MFKLVVGILIGTQIAPYVNPLIGRVLQPLIDRLNK